MDSGKRGEPSDQAIAPVAKDNDITEVATRRRIQDISELSEVELLTTLLGQSTEGACSRLITERGSLRWIATMHPLDWRDAGLGDGAVRKLQAILEIAKRYGETEWVVGDPFRGSCDVYAHYHERLATETREHFYAILLDNKHRKLRDVLLSIGSLTASIIHPRDVFSRIIRDSAAAVIFLHNHPSGDPTPSAEDLEITRRLRQVGEMISVRVLDHVVIGKGRYVSFVDDGYW
jgi:DNA repair protein RadC